MNLDRMFQAMDQRGVEYLLIGGANFMLRHAPVLTLDADFWIRDTPGNRRRCEGALADLEASWGPDDADWRPVSDRAPGWLDAQPLFCLTSPHGAIDVFRTVEGLDSWDACRGRGIEGRTPGGAPYAALADADCLASQLALPEADRKQDRIRALRAAIAEGGRP